MDLIKRPKKVQKSEKSYLSNEKYQDFSENQFKEIYEYLDRMARGGASSPIGAGMDYYGIEAPDGYMFADGSAISRTEYAELFKIIGTTYGEGDGSSTFNIPDKRERVSVMRKEGSTNGTTGATLDILGAKGGEFKHTITVEELAKHNHVDSMAFATGYVSGNEWNYSQYFKASNVENYISKMYTQNAGSSKPMNIMQSYLVCNYIIKVK